MIESASLSALAGMVRPMATATKRLATPSNKNSCEVVMPAVCRMATITVLPAMNAALSTLTAATTRAAVGASPGLHRREGRHDEQAAGDGDPGQIEHKPDAAHARENRDITIQPGNRPRAERREAEVEGEQAQQHGADQRRQQNDPPGCEPGRKSRADGDRDRKDREAGGHHLL